MDSESRLTGADAGVAAFNGDFSFRPSQPGTEVTVCHRIGYWYPADIEDVSDDEIDEADAYLEAYIQMRIEQALG